MVGAEAADRPFSARSSCAVWTEATSLVQEAHLVSSFCRGPNPQVKTRFVHVALIVTIRPTIGTGNLAASLEEVAQETLLRTASVRRTGRTD